MQTCAKMRVNKINQQLALCRNELRELRNLGVRYDGSEDEDSGDDGTTGDYSDTEEDPYEWEDSPINLQTLQECMSLKYIIENKDDARNITRRGALSRYILFLIDSLGLNKSEVAALDEDIRDATASHRD